MRFATATRRSVPFTFVLACFLAGCGAAGQPRSEPADAAAQLAFFENLASYCGQLFPGEAAASVPPDHELAGARMAMHVESCTDDEIRIPFHVDEDTWSRTWVITRSNRGLLLKHDHRHQDGTPEDLTMYGGWAEPGGTSFAQSFPADEDTAEMLPEAETNIWTLEIDVENERFVYDLTRHGAPRFRAEFDLSRAQTL